MSLNWFKVVILIESLNHCLVLRCFQSKVWRNKEGDAIDLCFDAMSLNTNKTDRFLHTFYKVFLCPISILYRLTKRSNESMSNRLAVIIFLSLVIVTGVGKGQISYLLCR